MDEDIEVKGDKENFSEEEEFDWLQQKDSMDELHNERRQSFKAIIEMEDQDLILMKNEVQEIIEKAMTIATDATLLVEFKKKNAKKKE